MEEGQRRCAFDKLGACKSEFKFSLPTAPIAQEGLMRTTRPVWWPGLWGDYDRNRIGFDVSIPETLTRWHFTSDRNCVATRPT